MSITNEPLSMAVGSECAIINTGTEPCRMYIHQGIRELHAHAPREQLRKINIQAFAPGRRNLNQARNDNVTSMLSVN